MARKGQERQKRKRRDDRQRVLAVCLTVCLILSSINVQTIASYAAEDQKRSFQIGTDTAASLENGVLTISGQGKTDDFTEDTAPFREYAAGIHTLVIEEGVTYIGSCLFYGLGRLGGVLRLPESITGFGDYAFSGASQEEAPHFTVIRNEFVQTAEGGRKPESADPAGPATPSQSEKEAAVRPVSTPDSASAKGGGGKATPSQAEIERHLVPSVYAEAPATGSDAEKMGAETVHAENSGPESGYRTWQNIDNPETLFYGGQTGAVFCSEDNLSFLEAAETAGYQWADGTVTVTLDDRIVLEVPSFGGQIALPDCPEAIVCPFDEGPFYRGEFAGWEAAGAEEPTAVLMAGELVDSGGKDQLYFYSVWKKTEKYHLRVDTSRDGDWISYAVTDDNTEETLENLEGYEFSYQWQIAEKGIEARPGEYVSSFQSAEKNEGWEDIAGANQPVYQRKASEGDAARQFRCAVTAVSLFRSSSAGEAVTLYSDAAAAQAAAITVYVDQKNGDDSHEGTAELPLRTMEAAAEKLTQKNLGGTADSNTIILQSDYKGPGNAAAAFEWQFLAERPVPVTIKGENQAIVFSSGSDHAGGSFQLTDDICFDHITLNSLGAIYCNGNSFQTGTGVLSSELCLYGASQNETGAKNGAGRIEVRSGSFAEIAGYAKNGEALYAAGPSNITIGGSAAVSSVAAGSVGGSVKNAEAVINIEGGTVTNVSGGCQGDGEMAAEYAGNTVINVSGGEVTNIYGAGIGNGRSIPSFLGRLEIHVTNGKVGTICGAGSGGYVTGGSGTDPSEITISVTGGTVGSIAAAGVGGNDSLEGLTGDAVDPASGLSGNEIAAKLGSVTGNVRITVDGTAEITRNIYGGGLGYEQSGAAADKNCDTTQNAWLKGQVHVDVKGGNVGGSIYGGGSGIASAGYETCARTEAGSEVRIGLTGGTVQGNVYGGGQTAEMNGYTEVSIDGGTVRGNVCGGGENGPAAEKTHVVITNGTVNGSVYGGAYGTEGKSLAVGGAAVDMSGGWVRGNLYGGSAWSSDGPEVLDGSLGGDLIFVNLTGGTVDGAVFGGGYMGKVNGSTHVHIGAGALTKCGYYGSHADEMPALPSGRLVIGGSVYGGGDFSRDRSDYDTIAVTGDSHVYVDGDGYSFGEDDQAGSWLSIAGGVFGSGNACDAKGRRLVTLDHYGRPVKNASGALTGASGALAAIQRADQVRLTDSHVQLSGQAAAANASRTARYALNGIGDRGSREGLTPEGPGLVMIGGSTLVLHSAAIEMAEYKSLDGTGHEVTLDNLQSVPNTILFAADTVFRISSTTLPGEGGREVYGAVSGYSYMGAADRAVAYARRRVKAVNGIGGMNESDGGFADLKTEGQSPAELPDHDSPAGGYRYWQAAGTISSTEVVRDAVLTAEKLESAPADGYPVAAGVIELPAAETAGSTYQISSVTISDGLVLADAAKAGSENTWNLSGDGVSEAAEKERITQAPLSTFGLYLQPGNGFAAPSGGAADGLVISDGGGAGGGSAAVGRNIGSYEGPLGSMPQLLFCLTYDNDGITQSHDAGSVVVTLERYDEGVRKETITVNLSVVTQAGRLQEQTVDLYAVQNGSYTGKLIIPPGFGGRLSLAGVTAAKPAGTEPAGTEPFALVKQGDTLSGYQVSITMQAVEGKGWQSEGLDKAVYDLSQYSAGGAPVPIGTADGRYDAPIAFTLSNAGGFMSKTDPDRVTIILQDEAGNESSATLLIHWQESVAADVKTASGKQYNRLAGEERAAVSQKSSVTAEFTIGNPENAEALWLELEKQDADRTVVPVPGGTKLTLLRNGNTFYSCEVNGGDRNQIRLSDFTKMWSSGDKLGGEIGKTEQLRVIVDFEPADGLPAGDYSLHLRNETGADPVGADFTVTNSAPTVMLSGGMERSEKKYEFTLNIAPNGDTRLADGVAVVLSPGAGETFPEGVKFTCDDGKETVPVGGAVFLMANTKRQAGSHTIVMDFTGCGSLKAQERLLCVSRILPIGTSTGSSAIEISGSRASASYRLRSDDLEGLKVAMADGSSRIVEPGTSVNLSITYYTQKKETLRTGVYRKVNGVYEEAGPWTVSGINDLSEGMTETKTVTVTIPQKTAPGTYRLVFQLGRLEVPYNLIVHDK